MLLVTPQSAVILCLATVGYSLCCSSLTSMLNSQCSGMPHGLYPTFVVGSRNLTLIRFVLGVILVFVMLAKVGYLNYLVCLFVLE
jgi:hypothetical protein